MRIPFFPVPCIFLCLALFTAGCGTIGEPMFPATWVPNPVTDLTVVQQGGKLVAVFTISPVTVEGLPVKEISLVDLRVGTGTFSPAQWAESAKLVSVPTPAKPSVVTAEIPIEGLEGKEALVGVRIGGPKGRMSAWSTLVSVHVEAPPDIPGDFTATAVAQGVQLRWQPGHAAAWRVFRASGTEKDPAPLGDSDKPEYLDSTATYGVEYRYFVRAVKDKAVSEEAGPATIKPEDKFPPAVPSGLVAVTGTTSIELTWQRNTEPDFKAYRLYRAAGDGAFELIADGLTAPSYSDTKIETGKRYRYAVAAVDQTGNFSDRSGPVEAAAP
jgi:hypothetical protein